MTTAVQRRRGTKTEHESFTGLEGEITVNTTNESLHVHDGSTTGGFETMRADGSNATSLNLNSTTNVDGVIDDDTMATASATKLATSESIKAYVDNQVGSVDTLSEILGNGNTSGASDIIISSGQSLTADTISETTVDAGVTIDSVLLKDNSVSAASIDINSSTVIDGVLDEDTLVSDSATKLATQQSIKAYVDGQSYVTDGDKGDVVVSSSGSVWTVESAAGNFDVTGDLSATSGTFSEVGTTALFLNRTSSYGDLIELQRDGTTRAAIGVPGNNLMSFDTGGTERMRIDSSGNVGIGVSTPTAKLHVRPVDETNFRVFDESTNLILASETNNGRDSNRGMDLESSQLRAVISGTTQLTVNSSGISVTDDLAVGGIFTAPSQPAFHAWNGSSDNNVTGNGAVATVDFNNESFDQGSNFSADTFTAPVDGRYQLNTTVALDDMSGNGGVDSVELTIVTSNASYKFSRNVDAAFAEQFSLSVLADMDASDTAYVTIEANGQTSDTTDITGGVSNTYFSGFLAC